MLVKTVISPEPLVIGCYTARGHNLSFCDAGRHQVKRSIKGDSSPRDRSVHNDKL